MAATDARPIPIKNTAYRHYMEFRDNTGALIAGGVTGQDTKLSLDGAAFADATNEFTEIGATGLGYVDLTTGNMNADAVVIKATCTNTNARPYTAVIYPQEVGDIKVDVQSLNGDSASVAKWLRMIAGLTVGTVTNAGMSPTLTQFDCSDITEATASHFVNLEARVVTGALAGQSLGYVSAYALTSGRGRFTVSPGSPSGELVASGDVVIFL